ncbi:MAG TPA: ATP-binding cassette domain-containing protein [Bacillota bacterium]|nr:ATP-binding cassette domain-containing protein [Bacillota bacterium]
MIKTKNLSKSFKDVEAVKDVTFTVNKGQIVGLLGENGAGKTTTLRVLATMLKPTAGSAMVNGYDIVKQANDVRRDIGILFGGEVGLYDRLTGRENIDYFAKLNGLNQEEADSSIEELVQDFQMQEYIDKRVGKYSRGMKQRVAISRSIVHKPTVMLFDEPTVGLDVSAAKIVHDFILKCKAEGRAIIFSSHTMQEVERLCDRIIMIHKGSIIEDGSKDSLMQKYSNNDMEEIFLELVGDEK